MSFVEAPLHTLDWLRESLKNRVAVFEGADQEALREGVRA
jgi:hypothetical protein